MTRGLALEFAPVRVNRLSPGLAATQLYDGLADDTRRDMFVSAARGLPAGLVGAPEHIAVQIMAFLANPYIMGGTVYIDGTIA
nr:SDR family oxidoreductase [Sandaracinobacteroides sayramensis]